ncbi:MAG: hypothetical protein L0Y54_23120, partial [Sporichthyaceae bacterium]|nr:hypothetical protein [Sporichthyaceae bacterium]
MTRKMPCRNLHWPVLALLIVLLGGCAFPQLSVHIRPDPLVVLQGESDTVTVTTTEPFCLPPLPCVDTTGQVFDFLVQNLPQGVTHSIDRSLQSPSTPGVVRITFEAGAGAVPGHYDVVVHTVLAGRGLDSTDLRLRIVPTGGAAVSAAAFGIAAGSGHSLAALEDGSVRAWGYNVDGQLGDGSRTSRSVPVVVSDLDGIERVAAGG